jgi:hypothetical protein
VSRITAVKESRAVEPLYKTSRTNSTLQHRQQRGNGAASVTERQLGFKIDFGHAAPE